jgi:hypothetical protein
MKMAFGLTARQPCTSRGLLNRYAGFGLFFQHISVFGASTERGSYNVDVGFFALLSATASRSDIPILFGYTVTPCRRRIGSMMSGKYGNGQ